ncbi:hypothetical protein LMIY3S_01167 [Labrys miyagiensis]
MTRTDIAESLFALALLALAGVLTLSSGALAVNASAQAKTAQWPRAQ